MRKTDIPKPPRALRWLMSRMKGYDRDFSLTGDSAEFYDYLAREEGKTKADLWYLSQIRSSLLPYLEFSAARRWVMLRIYFSLAFRNLKKQKIFSGINILGLSVSLACATWIYVFVRDETSYNRFLKNADSIYSIINTDNYFPYTYRMVPIAVGPALKEYFPDVENSVRLSGAPAVVRHKDISFRETCRLTDKNFFELFSFDLLLGDKEKVLESMDSLVLTQSAARKYFRDHNPMGKTLTVSYGRMRKDFFVTGIAQDPPHNSTIQFDVLIRIENLALITNPQDLQSWTWPRSETYIQLKAGATPRTIEAGFPSFVSQYFRKVIEERKADGTWIKDGETMTFWLQNVKDIHLRSQSIAGPRGSHIRKSLILAGIGILVLIVAFINTTNISIGRAFSRAVGIGMRKILGAGKRDIVRQFWSESIVLTSVSTALGLLLAILLLPLFNRLASKNMGIQDILTVPNLLIFGGLAVFIGILAGLYPGFILSNLEAIQTIKGRMKIGGKNVLTRVLITAQFSVSIFLILSTLVMAKQMRFINGKDLGFDKDGVIIVETLERQAEAERVFALFKTRAEGLASVRRVSGCTFPLGGPQGEGTLQYNNKKLKFRFSNVAHDYFATMGMKFLKGGDFPKPVPANVQPVVVNDLFVKFFEIDDPIGKRLDSSARPMEIVGVVEDYHYSDLHHEKEPVIHIFSPAPFNMLVRVSPQSIGRMIEDLRKIWGTIQAEKPFLYSFQDQLLEDQYKEEKRWNAIVLSSAVLVILITCMGLVGMTIMITSRRIKEIGIRRVLGASILKVSNTLCGDFLILTAASNVITWPLGYYVMNLWLKGFAYRTDLDIGIFIFAGLLTSVISLGTVGFLVFKAASSNPVNCLRYE